MYSQARAILWAQWRTLRGFYPQAGAGGVLFSFLAAAVWYGLWALGGVGVAVLLSAPQELVPLQRALPAGLLLVFLYWQLMPVLMVATGASLELKKLLIYPVPAGQLFAVEVLLRLTTGGEMLLILSGAAAGLLLNPAAPFWAPLPLAPFVLFNLFLSAGLRDLLTRLLRRRRIGEIIALALVLLAALPQFAVVAGPPRRLPTFLSRTPALFWPWGAAGRLAAGEFSAAACAVLLIWTAAAWRFGRWQFRRNLALDAHAPVPEPASTPRSRRFEQVFSWPSAVFPDPLAALLEKEFRSLSRAPRFRLVFVMGFSFGLLIWLPLAFGRARSPDSFLASNYLTVVSVYALLLLGDVLFWNSFGFDRGAVQVYFLAPVRFSQVLAAKNLAAAALVFLEIAAVAIVCALFRMPVTAAGIAEAVSVTAVLTLLLVAVGNLGSTHQPRPMSPSHSWRASSARSFQALLLLLYPLLCLPVALAYLARYAFDSRLAFYAVLAVGAAIGAVVYSVAMDTAVAASKGRRERIIATLSASEGPVGG